VKQYDFVVIGSGIAGLTFALKAAKQGSVAVITKRKGVDSNTAVAQGGIAGVTSDEDSLALHVARTLEAGAGLCDETAVRTIVMEGPKRVAELVELGLHFDDREIGGHREPDLGRKVGIRNAVCSMCRTSPGWKWKRRCCVNWNGALRSSCSRITWQWT